MPVFLRLSGYKVYFWSGEGDEPVHFHVTQGNPSKNDTKIWILSDGSMKIAHNKGKLPLNDLIRIIEVMRSYVSDYESLWSEYEGDCRHIDD